MELALIVHCAYTELVPTDQLKQHPDNNNRHSVDQIERLAKIIDYNGWRSPITVSKRSGFITKGHARLEAALKLGYDKVPVDYQDYVDEAHEYADITADNEIARWAELDKQAVYDKIEELDDIDIEMLGIEDFSFFDFEKIEDEKDETSEEVRKYVISVEFKNDMEMHEVKDDLISKGYIVKVLKGDS